MRSAWSHGPSRPGRPGRRATGTRRDSRDGRPQSRQETAGSPAAPAATVDTARLAAVIEPAVSAAGMDLESVRVRNAGRRLLLRVIVDADGGVGLDDIADVSRSVAAVLDRDNGLGDAPYTLEVSSPGVDRPLTEPKHWRRAAGRLVTVPLAAAGSRRDAGRPRPASIQGRVVTATSDQVTLDVDGAPRSFRYDELGAGRVQVEFAHAAGESPGTAEAAPDGQRDGGLPDGH
ncbi:MAG: ribosome maturation factor RimP [Actinobacteria bacterium]|nr:ribosome maturation factor RimP [Actinomycetota bacterium]